MLFSPIEVAAEDIKNGGMTIKVDDENRENKGDLVFAAEKITPEIINLLQFTHLPTDFRNSRAVNYEILLTAKRLSQQFRKIFFSQTTELIPVRVQTENITFAMFGSKLGETTQAIQSSLKKSPVRKVGIIL